MKTLVIIPAYNEQENILKVIDDIKNNTNNVDYVVINDCSKDETRNILKKNKCNFLDLPVNLGIGGGVQTGYKYAFENSYDIAIQFDGDGQHVAKYIENLTLPIKEDTADIVIGSRFLEKEGFQSSFQRRIGIGILSNLIYLLTKTRVKDVTSGFRAVNKKILHMYAEEYAQDYPEPEAIMLASMRGARITEIPVTMRERQGGESSIKAWKSVYYMIKVSLAIILNRMAYKKGGKA